VDGWLRKASAEHTYRGQAEAFDDLAAARERLRAVKANPPTYRWRVEFRSVEALDKKHPAATTWTFPQRCRTSWRLGRIWTTGLRHSQQLSAERQQRLAPAVGQKAEEADADEAMRQHMEEEAAQKLFRRHCHELLFAAMRVILPAEGNLTISEGHNPMVGNSNAMCVASQVMENVMRTSRREASRTQPSLGGKANEGKNGRPVLAQEAEDCLETLAVFSETLSSARP